MGDSRNSGSARRGVRSIALTAAALVALAGIFWGLRPTRADGLDPNAEYGAVAVERRDLRETVVASGTMEPLVRVPVIAEVSGIVASVHIEEGDRVTQGQPLFSLDAERLEARVAERRAELALRKAAARYDLIGRAKAERDHAKRELDRSRALFERRAISEMNVENAEHTLRLAEISVRDARAESAGRAASVDQARELLRQAERDLANAVVRAPIDGVIIERDGEIGRAVADVTKNGGTIIAVIADDRRLRLIAEVDENDVTRVRVGQTAIVTLDAFPEETLEGRVRKISAAGSTSGSVANFDVEIALEADVRLRVGMSSDARVVVREHRDVLLIPNRAIVRGETTPRVRVPDPDADYRWADVETAYSDGFYTIVSDGLSEGELVLVRSQEHS